MTFRQSLSSFFSENRISLLISFTGLLLSLYQFDQFKFILKAILALDSPSDIFTLKTIILFSILLTLSLYNFKVPVIPDAIVIPGIFLGLAISFVTGGVTDGMNSILSILALGGVFYLTAWFFYIVSNHYKINMGLIGGGTIKLSAMIGAYIGIDNTLPMIAITYLLLLPKYLLDIHYKKKECVENTAPYLTLSVIITIWGWPSIFFK